MELLIPSHVDALGLSAATKALVASVLSIEKPKVTVSENAERVTLVVPGHDGQVAKLIEPNAISRLLSRSVNADSKLIDFDEEKLWSILSAGQKLDAETSQKLVELLPERDLDLDTVVLFGDLHALVLSKGRPAISSEAPLLMWYQKTLSSPKVKAALATLGSVEFSKQKRQQSSGFTTVEPSVPAVTLKPKSEAKAVDATAASAAAPVKKEAPPKVEVKAPKEVIDRNVVLPKPDEQILPKKGEKNILITSALPYVNNVPHLGNIVGSVLSADFFARYSKSRGQNTLYICGTDEYGTATETKAIEENVTPLELCTRYHKIHKAVYDWFDIGFDYFGRTSTPQQTEIAQDIFLKLDKNGYLEEKSTEQLYCTKHEGYLADRFVEGTCPKCGFEDARGDQCDGCGQLLNPFELINPRCKLDNTTPEVRNTSHVFLMLDKLQPQLEEWLSTRIDRWPKNARAIVQNWLKEGLQSRAITRDLKWGTPVPKKGYEKKVLYVWFDAPIGYPSITAGYTDKWREWWVPEKSEDVELYQFMGKDNVPFHGVIFPSCEIGTGENWKTVDYLSPTEYLQYEGGKFSKSRNLGVFGNNAQEIGIPASVWRYYLACARPETADSQFSWRDFVTRNNSELLANLGNFVNRVIKFTIARYGGEIPQFVPDEKMVKDENEYLAAYIKAMDAVQLREGLEIAMRYSARGNQFLQENKLDNTLFMEHPDKCAGVIGTALNVIYVMSALIAPFMPATAKQICEQLNAPERKIPDTVDLALKPGHVIGKAQYLFTRIDEKKIAEWQAKFGGNQTEAKPEEKISKKAAKKAAKAKAKAAASPEAEAPASKET